MTIYHGSDHIIEKPEYGRGGYSNDFGRGFYCTESLQLAKEWACAKNCDGYANMYELDMEGLEVLNLNGDEYGILNWLALLTRYRSYWQQKSIAEQAKEYLQKNFLPDISGYDVIVAEYFLKKTQRDREARKEYRRLSELSAEVNDIYMIDIMRGDMKNGDVCLR